MSVSKILIVIITVVIFAGCQDSSNSVISVNNADTMSGTSLKKVTDDELFMPDYIPDVVNEKSVILALELNFSNVRILGVTDSKKPSYHFHFFDDDFIEQKAYVITTNKDEDKILNIEEVAKPYSVEYLAKTADDTKCWTLATIYDGYNRTGTAFTFSQTTKTYGWYHKVINKLYESAACCAVNYSGNLDNKIESHYWKDDYYSPAYRIARPISFHVFADINRVQSYGHVHYNFMEQNPYYTGFSPAGGPGSNCYQLNVCYDYSNVQDANGSGTYMHNIVSSLDMFYRVFTPTGCY